jgi:hypothetical protein
MWTPVVLSRFVIAAWYSAVAVIDELAPPGNGAAAAATRASVEPATKPMTALGHLPPKVWGTSERTSGLVLTWKAM